MKIYFKLTNIIVLGLFFPILGFSQNNELHCTDITLNVNIETNSLKTFKYEPTFKAKQIYKSLKQVTNQYPEQVMSSVLSANSSEWENFNYGTIGEYKMSDEKIKNVNNRDTSNIFYELLYKIEFSVDGEKYCIIKFNANIGSKKHPFAETMKWNGSRWIRWSGEQITELTFLVSMIKVEYLDNMFQIKKNGVKFFDDIVEESTNNNIFDWNKANELFKKAIQQNGKQTIEFMIEPSYLQK